MSTATLHNEKKKGLVPKLRFQEFDGEWEKNLLKEICTFFSGGTPTSTDKKLYNGNIPFIGSGNIYDSEVKNYITEEALNGSSAKLVKVGDILYALYGANSGEVAISKMQGAINQAILCIRTKSDFNEFVYYLLLLNKDKIVSKYLQGGQGNLSADIIKKLKYSFPTLPEQQKIASFLSAVDEKIQQLSRKKELLEQYKKGVMQQLLSGKLRFKDENGKDYADWEAKKLGEIGELKNGLNKDKKDFGFGSPFVNLMNVFGKSEIYNQEFDLVNSNEKEKILYNVLKGDVLFIRSSVKRSGVGETVIVQEDLLNTVYSGFLIRFRDDKKSLAQEFKKYCFSSKSFRDEILSYATSSANTNINQESLNKINIKLPCIEEQQKIANFLSSIDAKLESTTQQINQTQSFKKGLLQQMFV